MLPKFNALQIYKLKLYDSLITIARLLNSSYVFNSGLMALVHKASNVIKCPTDPKEVASMDTFSIVRLKLHYIK